MRTFPFSLHATAALLILAAGNCRGIDLGEALEFKGNWEIPVFNTATKIWETPAKVLPIHGARIIIRDTAPVGATADITGVVLNGKFAFVSPRADYAFDVILEPAFPGVDAAGEVTAAGGAGDFKVFRGIINAAGDKTTKGIQYSFNLGQKLDHTATQTSTENTANLASEGDVWAVFHGMSGMVREARVQLDVAKNAFDLVFPADFSFFNKPDIFVLREDRYDWDIVAHEFGHSIGDEATAEHPAASPGGSHDGSNQYDFPAAENAGTFQNKEGAIGLAYSEGFGTWFGGALLEKSPFKGKVSNVGDGQYTDTEDGSGVGRPFDTTDTPRGAYGDDTEDALSRLLWDLHDARNEDNTRTAAKIPGLADRLALEVRGLWDILKGSNAKSISEIYAKGFLVAKKIDSFVPAAGTAPGDIPALKKALQAGETFAEFGVSDVLFKPDPRTKLNLSPLPGDPKPKFEWTQLSTGSTNDLKLNKHRLMIYAGDLSNVLFNKDGLPGSSYELTDADLQVIRDNVVEMRKAGTGVANAVAAIVGESDTKAPTTGPYLSNGVELLLQDRDRAVVAVVDSSGSNQSTDPGNQRVVASKESLTRLVSAAEAAARGKGTVPDIAAAVDFDDTVTILSNFTDPDTVIPLLNAIDSSGGTSIDGGINAAIGLLDAVATDPAIASVFRNRSALIVFTDGENNSGPTPVIQAIVLATSKGIRVHFGFLQPINVRGGFGGPDHGPGEPTGNPVRAKAAGDGPATIEEAVRRSGGVFAIIGDASSQVAFVEQIFSRGLTNADGDNPSGGRLVGQANTADELTEENTIKSFEFEGRAGEPARIVIETASFQPDVTIFDKDGAILATAVDEDKDGRLEITLNLPYDGAYSVQVFAAAGATGLFNIFIDVENPTSTLPVIQSVSEPVLNRQTGLHEIRVTLANQSALDLTAVRLTVTGIAPGASLFNGTGVLADGTAFVDSAVTIRPGANQEIILEFFSPSLNAPAVTVAVDSAQSTTVTDPPGTPLAVSRLEMIPSGLLVEWISQPGKLYWVQFGDGTTWQTVNPPILANGNRIQWIDNGPPKTPVHPSQAPSRLYRIIESN